MIYHMLYVILELGRERQGHQEFNAGLDYVEFEASPGHMRLSHKEKKKTA